MLFLTLWRVLHFFGFLSHVCITIKADKLAAGIESENKSHELTHKWKIVLPLWLRTLENLIPWKKSIKFHLNNIRCFLAYVNNDNDSLLAQQNYLKQTTFRVIFKILHTFCQVVAYLHALFDCSENARGKKCKSYIEMKVIQRKMPPKVKRAGVRIRSNVYGPSTYDSTK